MTTTASPENQTPGPEFDARSPESRAHKRGSRKIWLRLLFMMIFVFIYGVSRVVVSAVVVLQFFWVLFSAAPNTRLSELGLSLASYTYQIICYLTFNTDRRPFPIDDEWPRVVDDASNSAS